MFNYMNKTPSSGTYSSVLCDTVQVVITGRSSYKSKLRYHKSAEKGTTQGTQVAHDLVMISLIWLDPDPLLPSRSGQRV